LRANSSSEARSLAVRVFCFWSFWVSDAIELEPAVVSVAGAGANPTDDLGIDAEEPPGFLRIVASSAATAASEGKRTDGFLAIILRQSASVRGSRPGRAWLGAGGSFVTI